MQCPECRAENPDVAQYCHMCGHALLRVDASAHGRDNSYAIAPEESVRQVAVLSTIMPHTNKEAADGYRWAFLITGFIVLAFNVFGLLPAAIVAAAFVVPVTYLAYIQDVNLWEETPIPVLATLFLLTGLVSTALSIVFFRWIFDEQFLALAQGAGRRGGGLGNLSLGSLAIFVIVLPVLAEVAKQAGPLLLCRKPAFDDQIDALTFGVAAGTAYAAFETVVSYAPVFALGDIQVDQGITTWIIVVLNLMIVKSLIYGTATALAVATYSGRGETVDGFTPAYWTSLATAIGANALYWLGVRLLAYAPLGQPLALLWGLLILGFLIVRLRVMLQSSLLEAAVEDAVRGHRHKAATSGGGFCPNCEVALLPESLFCIACGMTVRATSVIARRHIREPIGEGAG